MLPSPSLPQTARRVWHATVRSDGPAPVAFDSRAGVLWTVVIALDFFWLSNPLILFTFPYSLHSACGVTLLAVVLTARPLRPRMPWSVAAVLAFGLVTAVWSVFSRLTLDFTLIYVAVAAIALGVALTVDARVVAQGMLLGGVLVVLASVYTFETNMAGSAPAPGEGYIAGVGTNRNILSYTMIMALPFALSFLPRTWLGRALWLGGTATVCLGLYLTQSATGSVAAVLLVGSAIVMGWRDRLVARTDDPARSMSRWLRLVPVATLAVAVVVLVLVVQLSGRDAGTLTGRTEIWEATWRGISGWDRWIGTGWGTVWPHPWHPAGPNDVYTAIVVGAGGVALTHGHNSFFDLLPEVGLLGCLVFATTYVQATVRALDLRRLRAAPTTSTLEASRVALLGLLALVVYGITEPMSTIPLGWFVIVVLVAVIPRTAAGTQAVEEPRQGTPRGGRHAVSPAAP